MTHLFIHIGAHKTGTTTIQGYLDLASDELLEHDVTYPRSNWYHHSQHRMAFAMKGMTDPATREKPDFETELAALNREIRSAKTSKVLISSEEFFSCKADVIEALKCGLDCDSVTILAFLRRPDDFLLSIYNQNTKTPQNTFTLAIDHFLKDPKKISEDMDYDACVTRWADAFGSQNVRLLSYEANPPLTTLSEEVGFPIAEGAEQANLNISVPAPVVELMRLSKITNMPVNLRVDLYKLANRVFAGAPRDDLSGDQRREILTALKPDLEKLFGRFGMENRYPPELADAHGDDVYVKRPVVIAMKMIEILLTERSGRP